MSETISLDVEGRSTPVIVDRPADAEWLLVLAHGAGAGMRHVFMNDVVDALARARIASLRYEFPYMQSRSRRPDPPRVLEATVRGIVRNAVGDLPLFAGGKSMGGRMTSRACADGGLPNVRGLVFLGFPLHAAKQPSTTRADHLRAVELPTLFLQGTRDTLAELSLLRPFIASLGAHATLHVVDGADHGFDVLVRSGRTRADVLDELATTTAAWMKAVAGAADLAHDRRGDVERGGDAERRVCRDLGRVLKKSYAPRVDPARASRTQEAIDRLTARAVRGLERPESIEPRAILHGYRRALRIWQYTPTGDWGSWTAFVHGKQPKVAARVVRWLREEDVERIGEAGVEAISPTFRVADGIVSSADFELLVDLASRLRPPLVGFRRMLGTTGTAWGVSFEVGMCRATFEGWDREPDAWADLFTWTERMRALLQRSVDA